MVYTLYIGHASSVIPVETEHEPGRPTSSISGWGDGERALHSLTHQPQTPIRRTHTADVRDKYVCWWLSAAVYRCMLSCFSLNDVSRNHSRGSTQNRAVEVEWKILNCTICAVFSHSCFSSVDSHVNFWISNYRFQCRSGPTNPPDQRKIVFICAMLTRDGRNLDVVCCTCPCRVNPGKEMWRNIFFILSLVVTCDPSSSRGWFHLHIFV